ncbi:MAG: hypothetical protein Q4F82_11275 [bacterium]|nr:hypothetical protein [bacterium]
MVVKDILDRIRPIFDSEGNKLKLQKEDRLNIRRFIDQVVKQFKADMDDVVGYQVIQFPMVFDILLCQDDYNRLNKAIRGVLPEIVSSFYGIIKEKKRELPDSVVRNANKYWIFAYSASDTWKDEAGNLIPIAKGEVITRATLYDSDIRAAENKGNIDSMSSVSSVSSVSSAKGRIGSLTGTAYNLDILDGARIHANGKITFDFDSNLSQDLKEINRTRNEAKTLAVLTWESDKNGKNASNPFYMMENRISISGPKDTRNNPSGILKIDDNLVEQDHVQIRYMESEKKFEICAFADGVRLNQFAIPVSQGQNITWMSMSKKSSIIIRNYITIKFVAS